MNISDVYKKYEIPPNLADHQLTVAGVAALICEKTCKESKDEVVLACLLHDMGNIIKFDLDRKIPGAEIENINYWKAVKQKFIEKYGDDEHVATMEIAAEIGVNDKIMKLIDAVGFRHSLDTLSSGDISKMIAGYSDMRVAPHGVVSLESRLSDLTKRYGARNDREQYNQAFRDIENNIFSNTSVKASMVVQAEVNITKKELASLDV